MDFKELKLIKFMSYERATFVLDGQGLTLIEGENLDTGGSNGAGKTSGIVDGISWCLFDRTVRGLKGDSIINRKYGEGCLVQLTFEKNGHVYKVFRARKHEKFGSRLIFSKDDKVIEGGTRDITQKKLLDELGIDFDLFRCTVVFAQGDTFNFVNETDKSQKEILSKVRRINFTDALVRVRSRLRGVEAELTECERKKDILESHVTDTPGAEYEDDMRSWSARQKERLSEVEGDVKGLAAEHEKIKISDVTKQNRIIERIDAAVSESRMSLIERQERRDTLVEDVGYYEKSITKLKGLLDPECPECNQPIDRKFLDNNVKSLGTDLKESRSDLVGVDCEVAGIKERIEELMVVRSKAEKAIADSHSAEVLRDDLERRIKTLKRRAVEIEKETNPFKAMIDAAVEKQKKIKAKIKGVGIEISRLNEDIPYLRFWDEGFGDRGVKSFVFDSMCGTLNSRANHYLNILTDGGVSIRFDTQSTTKKGDIRERFECAVITDGETVPYIAYSGGEKTRISLAVDMALADLMSDYYGSKFNLLVHDEQDIYLDREGRQSYMRLLKERAAKQKVFVVAHDQEFRSFFDDVLTVQKKDGISCLM